MIKMIKLVVVLGTVISSTIVSASPRVVVSVPEIHSLVVSLMKGVDKPVLLLEQNFNSSQKLDIFQTGQVITSDLLIWVGAGLEQPLSQALQQFPDAGKKRIKLSSHIPLLPKTGQPTNLAEREYSRDLRFWNDTKLAIMAVRMIAPALVKLDPENTEAYLDNEIELIARLKQLENQLVTMLPPYNSTTGIESENLDRYFQHRFIASTVVNQNIQGQGFTKVSSKQKTCKATKVSFKQLNYGSDYYFDSMARKAQSVLSCIKQGATIKTAMKHQ